MGVRELGRPEGNPLGRKTSGADSFAVGGIVFAESSPGSDWLEANGALLNRTQYADLLAVIGTVGEYAPPPAPNWVTQSFLSVSSTASINKIRIDKSGTYYAAVLGTTSTGNLRIGKRTASDTWGQIQSINATPALRSCAFSSDATYLVIGHTGSTGGIYAYKRSVDTFSLLGALPNPPTAGEIYNLVFSPNDKYLAVASSAAPYLTIYERSGDSFTKLSDPIGKPTTSCCGVDFSPDGKHLAVNASGLNAISVFDVAEGAFNKLSLPTGATGIADSSSIAYSPCGRFLFAGTPNAAPYNYVCVFQRSGNDYSFTPYPGAANNATPTDFTFTPDGQFAFATSASSPYVYAYNLSSGTPRLAANMNVTTTITNNLQSAACSRDGRHLLMVGHDGANAMVEGRRMIQMYDGETLFKIPTIPQNGTKKAWVKAK